MKQGIWGLRLLAIVGLTSAVASAAQLGYQAVPRDAFPVFDNPTLLTAEVAERDGVVQDRDAVIGVHHGNEAKAYPITIMGLHELGNDTIDGIPIAVSW
ncbi:hypothetical protein NKDENANG_00993 [Candidatus Entotheonellaceae bacterium PAL068K]